MTLIKHEIKQSRVSLTVWTAVIGFLLAVCVFMFPEMKGEMDGISDMFASMGSFTEAFGMDKVNFGTLLGFYSVECGNILGLGGARAPSDVYRDFRGRDPSPEALLRHKGLL